MDDEMSGSIEAPPEPMRKIRADALGKAETAWKARAAGGTWAEAAQIAGYSDAANACRAVRRLYDTLPDEQREDMRNLWRERYERLFRQAYADVLERRPGAIVAAVRVAQAAVALDGLAAPIEIEVNPSREEIAAWVDAVWTANRPQLVEADIFADAEVIETSDP